MRQRFLLLIAAFSIAGPGFGQGRRLEPGTSAISGVVTDALSRAPINACTVTVSHLVNFRPASGGVATTGPDGKYSFSDIADGEYALIAECAGYLPSCFRNPGTAAPRCDNVNVAVDQRKANIDLSFTPGAIARGKVVDVNGLPVPGATVRLGMPLRDPSLFMNKPTQTARDGSFELSTLPSGEWRLEVEVPVPADGQRPPIIYFPGVLNQSDAGAIELVPGKALEEILVVVPPLENNRLTVRMVTLEQTLEKVDLALVRVEPLMTQRIVVDDTGTGSVTRLMPGRYFLSARGYSSNHLSVAFDVVDFTGDAQETLLYLQKPARIVGRIIGDKGGATPSLEGVRIGAAWVHDGVEVNPVSVDETAVAADGTFRFDGLFGTRLLRLFGLDPAFEVRSISEGRTDVTDSGVVLTADAEVTVVIVVGQR